MKYFVSCTAKNKRNKSVYMFYISTQISLAATSYNSN